MRVTIDRDFPVPIDELWMVQAAANLLDTVSAMHRDEYDVMEFSYMQSDGLDLQVKLGTPRPGQKSGYVWSEGERWWVTIDPDDGSLKFVVPDL